MYTLLYDKNNQGRKKRGKQYYFCIDHAVADVHKYKGRHQNPNQTPKHKLTRQA